MRECCYCKEKKNYNEFYTHHEKGYQSICKTCAGHCMAHTDCRKIHDMSIHGTVKYTVLERLEERYPQLSKYNIARIFTETLVVGSEAEFFCLYLNGVNYCFHYVDSVACHKIRGILVDEGIMRWKAWFVVRSSVFGFVERSQNGSYISHEYGISKNDLSLYRRFVMDGLKVHPKCRKPLVSSTGACYVIVEPFVEGYLK